MLPPLKPLPMKDRLSMVFVQYGQIDVRDGAFAVNRWRQDRAGLTDRETEPADHEGLPTRSAMKARSWKTAVEPMPAKAFAAFACTARRIAPSLRAVKPGHGFGRDGRRIGAGKAGSKGGNG